MLLQAAKQTVLLSSMKTIFELLLLDCNLEYFENLLSFYLFLKAISQLLLGGLEMTESDLGSAARQLLR